MSKVFGFVFTMGTLLLIGRDINWQGTGNMSEDNLTQVWTYINANFSRSWQFGTVTSSSDTTLANFTVGLSNYLNTLWDPAWNVVVVYVTDGTNADTVIYGYAFRDHWIWSNGNKMNDGYYVSFIIWKDYNCLKWYTHNRNTALGSTYSTTYINSSFVQTAIKGLWSTLDKNEIWMAAKTYADTLTSDAGVIAALGSDIAFSIIMSQSYSTNFYGRLCKKNHYINYDKVGTTGGGWGKAIILQMR